jgi:hypothetical protein
MQHGLDKLTDLTPIEADQGNLEDAVADLPFCASNRLKLQQDKSESSSKHIAKQPFFRNGVAELEALLPSSVMIETDVSIKRLRATGARHLGHATSVVGNSKATAVVTGRDPCQAPEQATE